MEATEASNVGDRIFENSLCSLIAFDWEFKKDEFRFEEFSKRTGWDSRRRFRNTCSSRRESSDYHLHLRWRIKAPESISVGMEFVKDYKAPDEDEKEPFAEDFVAWFNEFVLVKEKMVGMYADFDYPNDPSRQLRFPLPMRAPVGPEQVEVAIDGISFRISPPMRGIEKIWLTQDEKEVSIHLHAEKALNLASLEPRKEMLELSQVLESLFERKESQR